MQKESKQGGFLAQHKFKSAKDQMLNDKSKELFATYETVTDKNKVEKKVYIIERQGKYGLIDEKGHKITQIVYDKFTVFDKEKGLFKSELDDKVLVPAKFQDIVATKNRNVVFIKNYKYYGLFDTENNIYIAKPIYLNIESLDANNWKIYSNHKVGLVHSSNGNTVFIKQKYSEIEPYKNVFKTYLEEKVGIINSENGEILSEPLYSDIELISDESDSVQVYKTKTDNRYGVIFYSRPSEITILSPIYEDVQYKGNGRVNVLSDGYWRILDNQGNVTTR